jgi:hypothetical protein
VPGIITLLDGVRDNGRGNYMARCPAHDDRSPSLSIKQCDDGRNLLHCFAGCDVEDVCSALGLTLADLMPEKPLDHLKRRVRSTMPARDALVSLDHESIVVAIIASDIREHKTVDTPTLNRLGQAVERIGRTRDLVAPARHKP